MRRFYDADMHAEGDLGLVGGELGMGLAVWFDICSISLVIQM